jgi:mRNA-degrading endonuclease toxin of MazEF toxin-antitoxin module
MSTVDCLSQTTNRDQAESCLAYRCGCPLSARTSFSKDSDLLIDQLRAIDNRRLVQGPLSHLSSRQMQMVEHAIHEILDLPES